VSSLARCGEVDRERLRKPLAKICSLFIPKEFNGGISKNKSIKKKSMFSNILVKLKRS